MEGRHLKYLGSHAPLVKELILVVLELPHEGLVYHREGLRYTKATTWGR
jgi:hypothetical protein